MILGLDISTRMTGATVLDCEGKMLYNESWDTRNKNRFPDHFAKARFVKGKIEEIKSLYDIEGVYIEKPFMFFNSGGSTAKTMSSLQNFNGMVSWMCSDLFHIDPIYFTAAESRKAVGVKVRRGENSKQKSFEFVVDNEPTFVVEYTKKGNLRPGVTDRSDSWIIAKAGYVTCKNNKKS